MSKQNVAIYSRKSRFTGKGESIENQIELCRQYIAANLPNADEEHIVVYEDEGFSGGNLERPKFKIMMADAREKKFSAIVCYRLDRISRNIGDFAKLIEELGNMEIAFISIKEQFDTSSPMGRAMMYIASVFSQLERETIAERIRDNMHELSKTGRWLGGTTPTGYCSESIEHITVEGKVKKACKLKLLPKEAELVRLIFRVFLETGSLTKTETYLIQNAFITKKGKQFTRFALKNILSNPVYAIADAQTYQYLTEHDADLFSEATEFDGIRGIMAYNRTIQKAGKTNQIRPMNEWIVSVGQHVGLINGADWVCVQNRLEQNRDKGYRKPRGHVALLSGVLFCNACGDFMRPKLSNRRNAQGELIYTYLCSLKERSRSHCCSMKNANGNHLDKMVLEEMKALSEDNSELLCLLEQGEKKIFDREEYDVSLQQLRKSAEESETEIRNLVSALAKVGGSAAEHYIMQRIDELHEKYAAQKRSIDQLENLTSANQLSDEEFNRTCKILSSFRNTVNEMCVEEKRLALRVLLKQAVWDGQNVHIYQFGADEEANSAECSEISCVPLCEDSK